MWIEVAPIADLQRRKRVVVEHDDRRIVVFAHDGEVYALDDTCIHRQRQLSKGMVLNGRIVCPGHQWSFDLATGWEAVKQECQPTYEVRVEGTAVLVDVDSRRVLIGDTEATTPGA
jgi:nitrite reductase (NADH) small subunit